MQKAIIANPKISRNYYTLGLIYRDTGNIKEALTQFQTAADIVGNDNTIVGDKTLTNGTYIYEIAKTYSDAKYGDAMPYLRDAIKLNPNLKRVAKEEFSRGRFSELSTNKEFLNLIGA